MIIHHIHKCPKTKFCALLHYTSPTDIINLIFNNINIIIILTISN